MKKEYKSQAARDAKAMNYGDQSYWDVLEQHVFENADFIRRHGGSEDEAQKMITRTLGEALAGNDGD